MFVFFFNVGGRKEERGERGRGRGKAEFFFPAAVNCCCRFQELLCIQIHHTGRRMHFLHGSTVKLVLCVFLLESNRQEIVTTSNTDVGGAPMWAVPKDLKVHM